MKRRLEITSQKRAIPNQAMLHEAVKSKEVFGTNNYFSSRKSSKGLFPIVNLMAKLFVFAILTRLLEFHCAVVVQLLVSAVSGVGNPKRFLGC